MKQCAKCGQIYTDSNINFCLNDGELLIDNAPLPPSFTDDSPPTMVLDQSRITNPVSWPAEPPPAQPPAQWQPQSQYVQPAFGHRAPTPSVDQTLPIVSMIMGITSIALICCYGGIWLGIPAAIIGFLGMQNADRDPARYGGKGMAVAGMVLGGLSAVMALIFIMIAIVT
jgi:hypothetical protein